ncbi:ABC transporter permease [Streptomyces cyaneofuscatus]|uniref:ABC transporter permease n=1 Tax=Streptomyces cyaneofuscatus TaxID=66883 RepID=UPI0033A80182
MKAALKWFDVLMMSTRIGFRDLAAIYTWRTWTFGWFLRLVAQVVFFTAIGLMAGTEARVQYMAVGNSAAVACIEAMVVITATVRERSLGTLALQVAAPTSFVLTYIARGLYCLVIGTASSTGVFFIVMLIFGFPVSLGTALLVPLFMLLVGASSYCMGIAMGAIVCRAPATQWLALNLSYLSVMTFCGVNVPVGYWPSVIQRIADVLPLTHGLHSLRAFIGGRPAGEVVNGLLLELLVGVGWMAVGVLLLRWAVAGERRRGTIELSA